MNGKFGNWRDRVAVNDVILIRDGQERPEDVGPDNNLGFGDFNGVGGAPPAP